MISKEDRPVARLLPIVQPAVVRELGWGGADAMWMADDFDAPLDDVEAGR